MSSIGYLEYFLNQGYARAVLASYTMRTGREEYRDDAKKAALVFSDLEMELWSGLPDEILEKIFARLPLKSVLQVGVLSKSWALKVASPSFQGEVHRFSLKLRSVCPLHYHDDVILGYNPTAELWQPLLSLSYLPEHVRKDCELKFRPIAHNDTRRSLQSVAGCLICFLQVDSSDQGLIIHLTNPVNKSLRKLPHLVKIRLSQLYCVKLVDVSCNSYKVMLLELDTMRAERVAPGRDRYPIRIHIYDSTSDLWTGKRSFTSLSNKWSCRSIECFEGSVYLLYQNDNHHHHHHEEHRTESVSENVLTLGVYHVETEKWNRVSLPIQHPYSFSNSSLCVCGSSLIMVAIEDHLLPIIQFDGRRVSIGSIRKNSIRIYKLDSDTKRFVEISRGPPEDIRKEYLSGKFYHDEGSIFFSSFSNTTVITYDVCRQVWSRPGDERSKYNRFYGFLQQAFQPGLNPFVVA